MLEPRSVKSIRWVVLIAATIAVVFPMAWIGLASIKSPQALSSSNPFDFTPTWDNWSSVLSSSLPTAFLNSLIIGIVAVLVGLVVGVPGAYAIARYRTGGNASRIGLLVAQVLPPAVLVFPFLTLSYSIRTNGTIWAVLPTHISFVLPVVVWLLTSFFMSLPVSIEEQARVDGLNRWGAFRSVVLPQVGPGIAAAAIFGFTLSWNDMFYAQILTTGEAQTLPVAIASFNTFRGVQLGDMAAAIMLSAIPIVIATFFIQKRLVNSLGGGVKY